MSNRFMVVAGMILCAIVLVTGFLSTTSRLDAILSNLEKVNVDVEECAAGVTCYRLRHESTLILPLVEGGKCEPYALPDIGQTPTPATIEIPADASDHVVVELLLEYIDRVLAHDQVSKEALLTHYREYSARCNPDVDSPKTE